MKKLIVMLSIFVGSSLMASAQKTATTAKSTPVKEQKSQSKTHAVPEKVQEAFKLKFPTATSVKWEKENETEWEAEFKLDEKEYSTNFLSDGTWIETEQEITSSDLPKAVQQTLSKDFAGFKVEEVETTEKPNFKGYEVELKKGKEKMEVVFDANGKVISTKVANEKN